jgi:hypothetical protein
MAAGTGVARIEQALFGYREGHRLLAATTELSSEDRSLLARQTDHPDAGRTHGWESLLGGCPLPSGRYAVSMTWPAWEMPRPGCVWTHTLLLDSKALAACEPLQLLRFFRRPAGPKPDPHEFVETVELGLPQPTRPSPLRGRARDWACALTWALYDPPERPVRAASVDLKDTERHHVLLIAWGAAWPTLRGQLSFIDAPQTARRLPDGPYDLQLHQGSRIQEALSGERLLRGVPKVPAPAWAARVVAEVTIPDGFAGFLKAYDEELGNERSELSNLLGIYEAGAGRDLGSVDAFALIGRLASTYPNPADARTLKRDVASDEDRAQWLTGIAEPAMLGALLSTPGYAAFDVDDLNIQERARALLTPAHRAELALVLRAIEDPHQPLAALFLAAVSEGIDSAGLGALAKRDPAAVLALVAHEPALAYDAALWRALPATELWKAVAAQRGARQRRNTLAAMIAGEADIDPKLIAASWKNAGPLILEALAQSDPSACTASHWLEAVEPAAILKYMASAEFGGSLLTSALARLTPQQMARLSPVVLTRALSQALEVEATIACMLAAREMTAERAWADVAVLAYEQVLASLRAGKQRKRIVTALALEHELSATRISELVAERLNDDFRHGGWSPVMTFKLKDREAFRVLMNADRRGALAHEALLASRKGETELTQWQLEIINRAIADHADRDSLFRILQDFGRALNPF